MPAVFVHGVPDTPDMWDRLLAALDRTDVITLALPGFTSLPPSGWHATKEEYAAWLEDELAGIGEPVDLVAHDWGAILAQRVTSVRPDLVRTLACGSGPLDRTYEWHPMAQSWQTPEVGEQIMESMLTLDAADLTAGLAAGGAPPELAAQQAEQLNRPMAECILALYRSAITVGVEWQDAVEAMPPRPTLVVHGEDDPYVGAVIAERLADRLGGELVIYPGCSHWWPWARARDTAAALTTLWDSSARA